ncbi:MAG: entericidin A/B family lipoprotein [Arenimonas sp.]
MNTTTFRKPLALLLLSIFIMSITACNTVAGIGKDTQKVGEEIEEEAEKHD